MGLGNIGASGFILILVVLLFVFGPSKLPEVGKSFGKSLREFRSAARGIMDEPEKSSVNSMDSSNQKDSIELLKFEENTSGQGAGHESCPSKK